MKNLLLVSLFLLALSYSGNSQCTGIEIQSDTAHYSMLQHPNAAFDFTGYVTHTIWANFTNPDDELLSIYAVLGDQTMYMQSTDVCYNDDVFAGYLGTDMSGLLWSTFPDMRFDTYWTIGARDNFYSGCPAVLVATTDPPVTTEPCQDVFSDGVVFNLPGGCGAASIEQPNKVLIGQITTPGDVSVRVCTQTLINGIIGNDILQCFDEVSTPNPCIANPIEATLDIVEAIDCNGELATLDAGNGGNGDITYELYIDGDATPFATQTGNPIFTGVPAGDYYVAYFDEVFCRDTSEVVGFVDPPLLEATGELTQDNLCFGDDIADFCVDATGGTGDLIIQANDACGGVFSPGPDGCFEDLSCCDFNGNYTWEVIDDNGCSVDGNFTISCPAEIVIDFETTDALCNGICDGTIIGSINGGTGDLVSDWDSPTLPDPIVAPGPLNLEYTSVCEGVYTLDVIDQNGCIAAETVTINEPDTLEAIFTPFDVSCFSLCDGEITQLATGGTPGYTFFCTDADGLDIEEGALCAGTYNCVVEDSQGCVFSDSVTIMEPSPVTYSFSVENISCNAACDGSICIDEIEGGCGTYTYQITSPVSIGPQDEPCFENLCPGDYTLVITDCSNCTSIESGIILTEPDPITVFAPPVDVQCFGLNNGEITVNANGGTGPLILFPDSIALPAVLDSLAPGVYEIQVQDSIGCIGTATTTINEPELLELDLISSSNPFCGGDCNGTVVFEVSGGLGEIDLIYSNSTGDSLVVDPNNLCADLDWQLIASDVNGCMDTITFEIEEPDPIIINYGAENVTCTGMNDGSVVVLPSGGTGDIEWYIVNANDEEDEVDIFNMFEGEYCVFAIDSTLCETDTCFFIEADMITDMTLNMFSTPVTCWNNGDGTATAGVSGGTEPISYQWNDTQQQTTQTAVGLDEDTYSVVVVDAIGCTLSDAVVVNPTIGCFFIADAVTPNGDGANDFWTVGGLEHFPSSTVEVYNRWGQLLFQSKGYDSPWDGKYNGNDLPIADYYYIITYDPSFAPVTGTVTIKY